MRTAMSTTLLLFMTALISTSPAVEVGDVAPDFTLLDVRGERFTLSEQKERITVLFFIGYDCGSCLVEAPDVELNIHKQYQPYGVQVVAIDIWDGTPSTVNMRFVLRTCISFPVLTYGSAVGRLYNMTVSNYVVVGIDGRVKYITRRYDSAALQSRLDSLTATPGQRPKVTPTDFRLEQNFPNPFNSGTRIEYELIVRQATRVTLTVYDILGKRIRRLIEETQKSGFYQAHWDGRTEDGKAAPAGTYLYVLRAGEMERARRMTLLK